MNRPSSFLKATIIAVICLFIWLLTLGETPSRQFLVLINYLILGVGSYFAVKAAFIYFKIEKFCKITGISLSVLIIIIYGHYDEYIDVWYSLNDPVTNNKLEFNSKIPDKFKLKVPYTEYMDTYERWSRTKTYRYIFFYNEQGELDYSLNGPIISSNKPHGEWHYNDWHPPQKSVNAAYLKGSVNEAYFTSKWYWYGEEISEGEWALRNHR